MMRLFSGSQSRRTPIGIDIGLRSIKAAQLRQSGSHWTIEHLANFPRAGGDQRFGVEDASRLQNVLRRMGFRGSEIILAVPSEKLLSGMLELPPRTPGVPIDQIALTEFARIHTRQPAELQAAFWDLPSPARAQKATHLMAVGCATADADAIIDTFAQAELTVAGLDHFTSALSRAGCLLSASSASTTAIVDLGWSAATLALVRGGILVYERRMPEVSGHSIHQGLQKQLAIQPDEADLVFAQAALDSQPKDSASSAENHSLPPVVAELIGSYLHRLLQELQLAFSYIARQYANAVVSEVLLSGGGAAIDGINSKISEGLEVNCRTILPADVAAAAGQAFSVEAGSANHPSLIGAIGLAMLDWRRGDN